MYDQRLTESPPAGARDAALSALIGAYGLVNRCGVLDTRIGRAAFSRTYFAYKRFLEDPFDGLVRRRPDLFAGGHVVDVGANIGYTALTFARALSPGFLVHAFEPDPRNFGLLAENLRRAGEVGRRVAPVPAAVGDKDGEIAFRHSASHHGDHRVAVGEETEAQGLKRVRLRAVDAYLEDCGLSAGAVRFVKIDVQGYEAAVVRGMAGLLRHGRPAVAIEYGPDLVRAFGGDPRELVASLLEGGRRPFLLKKSGALKPLSPAAIDKGVADREWVNLLFSAEEGP